MTKTICPFCGAQPTEKHSDMCGLSRVTPSSQPSALREELMKAKAKIAAGEIDLRDIGKLLFGIFDQDLAAAMIDAALSSPEAQPLKLSPTTELIERLGTYKVGAHQGPPLHPKICDEAASRLSSLSAEVERLTGLLREAHDWMPVFAGDDELTNLHERIDACIKELPEGWRLHTLMGPQYTAEQDPSGDWLCCLINTTMPTYRSVSARGPDPLSAMRAAVEKIPKLTS